MKFKAPRLLCLLFCLMVWFSISRAQQQVTIVGNQTQPAVPAPTPAIPPEQKAYTDASRLKDPEKKIEALEKLIADYPDRFQAFLARGDILDTLIKNYPTQIDRIRAAAEKYLAPQGVFILGGGSNYVTVATKLMDAGIMLDWAEEVAKKGAALTEEENNKNMRKQRARFQDALGRIYLKQGKTKLAKNYLKQALANDPELSSSLIAMGQISEKSGNHKAAFDYLSSAAVKTSLKKADRQLMESAYRVTHDNSLTGLEQVLDDKYRQLNAGIRFEHYTATPKRSNRTALAELFTGSGCGPCVAADLGFDGMLERYNRQELVVLVYHLHIPLPDPMTNTVTVARGKYYEVPGTPTFVIDGNKLPTGGGSREMVRGFFDRVDPKVVKELESPAEAELKLTATLEGDQIKTRAVVDRIKQSSSDLKLQIALTEDELRYTGENGIRFHPMVVRSLAGKEAAGFGLAASGATNVEWTFDLKAMTYELKKYLDEYEQKGHRGDTFAFSEKKFQIDPGNLSLVAFVQDMKTKAVLQTVYLKIKPATTASAQTAAAK
jgi:tetratricopeptide (TPR) repeat protein